MSVILPLLNVFLTTLCISFEFKNISSHEVACLKENRISFQTSGPTFEIGSRILVKCACALKGENWDEFLPSKNSIYKKA